GAVHIECADWGVLDFSGVCTLRNLLVALSVLGTAGGREVRLVDGAQRMGAGGICGADAVDEYDADAAAGGVARYVLGVGDRRVSAEKRSDVGAAVADDDVWRNVHRWTVARVPGGAEYVHGRREEHCSWVWR